MCCPLLPAAHRPAAHLPRLPLKTTVSSKQTLGDQERSKYMRGQRTLEINPRHPLIRELKAQVLMLCSAVHAVPCRALSCFDSLAVPAGRPTPQAHTPAHAPAPANPSSLTRSTRRPRRARRSRTARSCSTRRACSSQVSDEEDTWAAAYCVAGMPCCWGGGRAVPLSADPLSHTADPTPLNRPPRAGFILDDMKDFNARVFRLLAKDMKARKGTAWRLLPARSAASLRTPALQPLAPGMRPAALSHRRPRLLLPPPKHASPSRQVDDLTVPKEEPPTAEEEAADAATEAEEAREEAAKADTMAAAKAAAAAADEDEHEEL